MCFKNCDKESRKIPITLGVLVIIFIVGLFFAVSSQGEKNYEAFLKSRLAQHGVSVKDVKCFYDETIKVRVCDVNDITVPNNQTTIKQIKITNVDGIRGIFDEEKNIKNTYVRMDVFDIQNGDGENPVIKEIRNNYKNYEPNPEEMEKFLNTIKSQVVPLNMTLEGNVSTQKGSIEKTDIFFTTSAGPIMNFTFGLKDVSLQDFLNIKDMKEISKSLKFSKFFISGSIPNSISVDDKSKQEIKENFASEMEVFSDLYGLDGNLTAAINKKLDDYLTKDVFKFKISLINQERDDVELIIGNFVQSFMFNNFKLNNDLLKRYKIEIE